MKRLQDIADQVGVSRTTVSNVLHGNTKKVSKEMIRKISEILNQEGYVPDTSSRELTRKGSCIIGLVLGYNCIHGIPSLRDTFVAEFLSGVEETAHRNGYYVMLINGHDQNTDRVAEIASYNKIVVFIDRSPAECYNKFRMLWIGGTSPTAKTVFGRLQPQLLC